MVALYCSKILVLTYHTKQYCNPKELNMVGYARTNVIGPRTSFVIASVDSSIH
jgi:hypothetical protein